MTQRKKGRPRGDRRYVVDDFDDNSPLDLGRRIANLESRDKKVGKHDRAVEQLIADTGFTRSVIENAWHFYKRRIREPAERLEIRESLYYFREAAKWWRQENPQKYSDLSMTYVLPVSPADSSPKELKGQLGYFLSLLAETESARVRKHCISASQVTVKVSYKRHAPRKIPAKFTKRK